MYKADFIKEKEEYGVCVLRKKCYKYTKMFSLGGRIMSNFFSFLYFPYFPEFLNEYIYIPRNKGPNK